MSAQSASKIAWKVPVVDSAGKTKENWVVLEDKNSNVGKLQMSVEGRVNKKRAAAGKTPVSLDMQMDFGGDLCQVDEDDILLELVPSPAQGKGFVATFKPVPAVDDGGNANDDADSRPSKKPRTSDTAQATTQWQTISANGGADEAVVRAEKVILVAVNAKKTDGDEARVFADKLLSAHFGRTKSPSKNKAEQMARTIEKKLVDMITIEGDKINVDRKKFRGIFRTKTYRQGHDCFTRFLLGTHYVENENGSNDCDAIDGETTESCILELLKKTKKEGRESGSLQYYGDSLDTLAFTRAP